MTIDTNKIQVGGYQFRTSGNISFNKDNDGKDNDNDKYVLAPKSKLNDFERATYATYERYFGNKSKPDPASEVV